MRKRDRKLSLHRETLRHLELLANGKLGKVAAGMIDTSCTEPCACGDCPAPVEGFEKKLG